MKLNFVLNNEGLSLVINLLWELGGYGMVSCSVLDYKTFVAVHSLVHMWLLDGPLSNVCPFLVLVRALGILLGVGWLPSGLPVVCELFKEVTLDGGRLCEERISLEISQIELLQRLTVKVGSSAAEDVADSVTSLATLATDELALLRTD